jgi:MFS family permease
MLESKPAHPGAMSDLTAVLIACCLAMLAVGDNSTAIMAALPAMTDNLHLSAAQVEWVVNAYLLAAAVFIILGGEAADRFGARNSSTFGIGLFALASLLIALGPTGIVVIAARALQGLGGAFAVAGTLAAVSEASPESKRPQSISAWTGFLMLGFSIGPLVGGAMTHYAGWRSNFWLNVIVLLPPALILWRHPGTGGRRTRSMDWVGLVVLAVFMITLVSGLHALPKVRSMPLAALAELAVAALAFVALIWVEKRQRQPLVDLGAFSHRNFAVASGLVFLLMFDINLFAQSPHGLGMSAVEAGLALVPLSIALFGFARAAPWLAGAIGLRTLLIGSSLLLALGCAVVWVASAAHGQLATLMLGLFVTGAGIAIPYASAPRVGLATLPQTQGGKGSGILNSCSFLGGTIGVTCGGIVFGLAGFPAVLAMLGFSAFAGAALASRLQAE